MKSRNVIVENVLSDLGSLVTGTLSSLFFGDDTKSTTSPAANQQLDQLKQEQIPLSETLAILPNKRALIICSTQAEVIAPELQALLSAQNFTEVNKPAEEATSLSSLVNVVKGVDNRKSYDVVIIVPDFMMEDNKQDLIKIINLFTPARCFVIIPPPVTNVADIVTATLTGMNRGKPVPPDYWFKLKEGKYAPAREKYCAELKVAVKSAGSTAIDPRDILAGGRVEDYPEMNDGIHPSAEDSKKIADVTVEKIMNCNLPVSSASIITRLDAQDIKADPELASKFSKYPVLFDILQTAVSSPDSVDKPNTDEKRPIRPSSPSSRPGSPAQYQQAQYSGPTGRVTRGPGQKDDPVYKGRKENHQGLDIAIPVGTPVRASLDGVVNLVGDNHKAAGNYVDIKHPDGYLTRYLHLSEIHVEKGQRVKKGDVVGLSGGAVGAYGSGKSNGPHLHWETWRGPYRTGKLFDPRDWLEIVPEAIKPVNF